MENVDYKTLGFSYHEIPYRFVAKYKDGKWDDGCLSDNSNVVLNESAAILQYCGQVFEGLKAYRTVDNRVVLFRPDMNARRLHDSAEVMQMPPFDEKRFVDAVKEVVKANIDYVPPYNSGASLYLRPYIFGTNPILGVKPASEYEFRIFGSPVGPYFVGDKSLKRLFVSSYDRTAPHGTGNIKAGLNYAMSLRPYVCAHKAEYDENLYLDSASRTYIEETGGANILFIDKNNKVVTPKSDSILPSITRKSILYVAKHYLNLEIEERPINVNELDNFVECGLCGTAAVIAPVGSITDNDKEYEFKTGPIVDKLRDMLLGIQKGAVEAPDGWIVEVK